MRYLLPLARPKLLALLALAVARTAVANRLARVQGYMFRAAFLRLVPLFVRDFAEAARHAAHVIRTQWRFAMLQDFTTKYAAATVAVVLIIGPFFRGDLRPGKGVTGRASMLANMR